MNVSCSESESQEFTIIGFNDVAFGRVNDQLQALLQVSTDTLLPPMMKLKCLMLIGLEAITLRA